MSNYHHFCRLFLNNQPCCCCSTWSHLLSSCLSLPVLLAPVGSSWCLPGRAEERGEARAHVRGRGRRDGGARERQSGAKRFAGTHTMHIYSLLTSHAPLQALVLCGITSTAVLTATPTTVVTAVAAVVFLDRAREPRVVFVFAV